MYIRSDLALVYIYIPNICSYHIRDATETKTKGELKMTRQIAMLSCTLSTDLQISMGE